MALCRSTYCVNKYREQVPRLHGIIGIVPYEPVHLKYRHAALLHTGQTSQLPKECETVNDCSVQLQSKTLYI